MSLRVWQFHFSGPDFLLVPHFAGFHCTTNSNVSSISLTYLLSPFIIMSMTRSSISVFLAPIYNRRKIIHACMLNISHHIQTATSLFFYFFIFSSKWLRSGFSLCLQNVHQGYPVDTYMRFLKAREGNVSKAHNMVRSTSVLPFQISFLVTSDHSLFLVLLSL